MLPNRINLVGRFCSGKGFISDLLVAQRGFQEISYSDPLYEELAASKGLTVDFLKDNKADFRSYLQGWGHSRRQNDPNYWITQRELAVDRYREFKRGGDGSPWDFAPVVEAGTRYENEALDAIQRGGFVVRVKTPDRIRYDRYYAKYKKHPTDEQNNYPSEVGTDTLPVHVEIPGNLPAALIIPTLEAVYAQLCRLREPQEK